MEDPGTFGYLLILGLSWVGGLVTVPLARRVALAVGMVDRPGGYKQQAEAVPYLGGVAVAVVFSAVIAVAVLLQPPVAGSSDVLAVLGVAAAFAVVGLVDDARPLSPSVRTLVVVLGALVLYATGTRTNLFAGHLVDLPVTVLWVVGITNAMNLLDNMDGAAGGVGAVAAASFGLLAALNGQFLVASLALALTGVTVAFLRHNRFPARIYLGDAGSMFIGCMLAVLGIRLRFSDAPQVVSAMVPVVVLGVPILDTTVVVVSRLRRRVNPLQGGRDHLSHRLARLGAPTPVAVGVLHGAGLVLGLVSVAMSRSADATTAAILMVVVVLLLAAAGAGLSLVPATDD